MLRSGPARDALAVEKSYEQDGVSFSIYVTKGSERLRLCFPINFAPYISLRDLLRQRCITELECLEDLWISGDLTEREGAYILPYERLYTLDADIRRGLELPEPATLEMNLHSVGAVGQDHFRIRCVLRHPEHGFLDESWIRRGCVMTRGQTAVLLPSAVVALLEALADRPTVWTGDEGKQPEYAARVRTRALQAGARLDPYLEREEYLFPERLDINVGSPEPGTITLTPLLHGVPPEVNEQLDTVLPPGRKYGACTSRDGRRRFRLFLGDKLVGHLEAIRKNRTLHGHEAAKFMENPAAFLPEDLELDLADFSERVKGLALRVYRAQPFISANPMGRGWFDVEAGVKLRDVADLAEEVDMPMSEFRALAERALQCGQEYVEWNDSWVHIPPSMQSFLVTEDKLRHLAPAGRVDVTRLPYVLEIFENVLDLEYSPTLVDEKAKLEPAAEVDDAVPAGFKLELRPFQRAGYTWMRRQRLRNVGCLLADEMGLGKTIQTLAFLCHLHEQGQVSPSLVVAPLAIIDNWLAELRRCLPPVVCYRHLGPHRSKDIDFIARTDLVFTTYETLVRDQLLLGQVDWRVVVCDEAQKIKNYTAMSTRVAKALKASLRMALTGTPVENSLGELWCIGDFVQPGLLGSYREFRSEFELPLARAAPEEKADVESRLLNRLVPIYLRRTKKEVLKNLPPLNEHQWTEQMSDVERRLYLDVLARARAREIEPLVAIRRLLDICAHPDLPAAGDPALDPEEMVRRSSKLELTLRLMDQVATKGEKVVVFCHLRNMQRILRRVFMWRYELPECFVLNGETQNRLDMVERFNRQPYFGAIIVSPKAGGVGLNITGANHAIHYVRWWNPAVESQATARVHRIGQAREVHVHYPILTHPEFKTADVILDELLREKRELAESVLVPTSRLEISENEFASRIGL